MIYEKIFLKNLYNLRGNPLLEVFVCENFDHIQQKKPTLIIVPGGGYQFVSKRESDPVALTFLMKGYNCFVLNYSVKTDENLTETLYPNPHLELIAAFDYITKNKEKYFVEDDKIFAIGFSAGAHLVGSYGYLYKNADLLKALKIKDCSKLKPNGIALAYPVITMRKITHGGSMINLTQGKEDLINLLSIEDHVDSTYPPTFLWTTIHDTCVPYENTLLMQKALNENNVKNKTIIYQSGDHGLSIANKLVGSPNEEVSNWVNELDAFFKSL